MFVCLIEFGFNPQNFIFSGLICKNKNFRRWRFRMFLGKKRSKRGGEKYQQKVSKKKEKIKQL